MVSKDYWNLSGEQQATNEHQIVIRCGLFECLLLCVVSSKFICLCVLKTVSLRVYDAINLCISLKAHSYAYINVTCSTLNYKIIVISFVLEKRNKTAHQLQNLMRVYCLAAKLFRYICITKLPELAMRYQILCGRGRDKIHTPNRR